MEDKTKQIIRILIVIIILAFSFYLFFPRDHNLKVIDACIDDLDKKDCNMTIDLKIIGPEEASNFYILLETFKGITSPFKLDYLNLYIEPIEDFGDCSYMIEMNESSYFINNKEKIDLKAREKNFVGIYREGIYETILGDIKIKQKENPSLPEKINKCTFIVFANTNAYAKTSWINAIANMLIASLAYLGIILLFLQIIGWVQKNKNESSQ